MFIGEWRGWSTKTNGAEIALIIAGCISCGNCAALCECVITEAVWESKSFMDKDKAQSKITILQHIVCTSMNTVFVLEWTGVRPN